MVTNKGDTSLHTSAERGDIEAIKQAVEQGANTSAKNNEGKTPAEVATDPSVAAMLNAPGGTKEESFVTLLKSQPRTGFPLPPLKPLAS